MLRVFISYPYREETKTIVHSICEFLSATGVELIDGKWVDATIPLPEDIKGKIRKCDLLLSFVFEGINSPWVDQEIGFAKGSGIDVIQITVGNVPRSGFIAEQFHISYDLGETYVCTHLMHTIKNVRQKLSATIYSEPSSNAPIDEYKSEGWSDEELDKLDQIRLYFSEPRYDKLGLLLPKAIESHPRCWRFHICFGALLVHTTKYDDADKVFVRSINEFQDVSRALSYAFDNRGWVLSFGSKAASPGILIRRVKLYQEALFHEARREPYFRLIYCLLELNKIKNAENIFVACNEKFPDSIPIFTEKIRIEGASYVRAFSKSQLLSSLLFPKSVGLRSIM